MKTLIASSPVSLRMKIKKGLDHKPKPCLFGRRERIRTSDPYNPIVVRYQTALHAVWNKHRPVLRACIQKEGRILVFQLLIVKRKKDSSKKVYAK